MSNTISIVSPYSKIKHATPNLERVIEEGARICYRSEEKLGANPNFIPSIIRRGHHSVLEHGAITVDFLTDRAITHELVRHRIASFSQESTRYCNYNNKGLFFAAPAALNIPTGEYDYDFIKRAYPATTKRCFLESIWQSAENYLLLLKQGEKPETARAILPNCLAAKIRITANPREWRHIFTLRTAKGAHPDMQILMKELLNQFVEKWPILFTDIKENIA